MTLIQPWEQEETTDRTRCKEGAGPVNPFPKKVNRARGADRTIHRQAHAAGDEARATANGPEIAADAVGVRELVCRRRTVDGRPAAHFPQHQDRLRSPGWAGGSSGLARDRGIVGPREVFARFGLVGIDLVRRGGPEDGEGLGTGQDFGHAEHDGAKLAQAVQHLG